MTPAHVWKKAPKGWTCTSQIISACGTCFRPAVVACKADHGAKNIGVGMCTQARCSRHKPRKRGVK
jgi:hypothetical protein